MMMPAELIEIVDSEQTDFIIKSKRNYPKRKGLILMAWSVLYSAFMSVFVINFIVPVLKGKEVHFEANGIPTSGSLDNLGPLVIPGLVIILLVLVGIGLFIAALLQIVQKGGYFVGTETRFIKYRNGKVTILDWEQFSGNIKINAKSKFGDLELELRTGQMKSRDNGFDKYVPDVIHISGIKNVFEIEKKCRFRIKENDPTPRIITGNND